MKHLPHTGMSSFNAGGVICASVIPRKQPVVKMCFTCHHASVQQAVPAFLGSDLWLCVQMGPKPTNMSRNPQWNETRCSFSALRWLATDCVWGWTSVSLTSLTKSSRLESILQFPAFMWSRQRTSFWTCKRSNLTSRGVLPLFELFYVLSDSNYLMFVANNIGLNEMFVCDWLVQLEPNPCLLHFARERSVSTRPPGPPGWEPLPGITALRHMVTPESSSCSRYRSQVLPPFCWGEKGL